MVSLINEAVETTASEIAKTALIDKGQISRTVKSLVSKGLVLAGQRDGARRQTMLKLTVEGKALHGRIVAIMIKRQRHLAKEFSDEELAAFHAALDKLERASRLRSFQA